MNNLLLLLSCVVLMLALGACSTVPATRTSAPTTAEPASSPPGAAPAPVFAESGKASFYAMKYQFRKTASGERFNQLAKTAAHKSLPFGSRVRVTNVSNGKSVIVRINDRGPFIDGRIIDLTRSAFSSIAELEAGVIDVRIDLLE